MEFFVLGVGDLIYFSLSFQKNFVCWNLGDRGNCLEILYFSMEFFEFLL